MACPSRTRHPDRAQAEAKVLCEFPEPGRWEAVYELRKFSEVKRRTIGNRIPKSLHRELKLHCVHADTSVMDFVVAALKEKLATQGRRGRRAR